MIDDAFSVLLRILLAAVLLSAGAPKLRRRSDLREAANALGVPEALSGPVGVALPAFEVGLALLLLPGATAQPAAITSVLLLCGFTALLIGNLSRGSRPSCHCFGQASNEPISWWSVARNGTLIAAAVWASVHPGPGFLRWSSTLLSERSTLHTIVAVLGLVVVGQAVALVMLWRRHEVRPDVADRASTSGLAVGTRAPGFSLPSTNGHRQSLSGLLARGKPVLLVFTSPTCLPCEVLLPDVAAWTDSLGERLTIAVIGSDDEASNARKAESLGIDLLLDPRAATASRYRYGGTPGAVVVGPDSRIASGVHSGAEDIRRLVHENAGPVIRTRDVGEAAPDFELRSIDGDVVSNIDLLGTMALLVFWSPGCEFCQYYLPDFRSLERSLLEDGGAEVVVISEGSAMLNRRLGIRSTVLLDEEGRRITHSFGVDGTPMAVLVDAEGRIASDLAGGGEAVTSLAHRAAALTGLARRLQQHRSDITEDAPTRS